MIEKEITIINSLIEQANYHGGNPSEPYRSNEVNLIKSWLEFKGIADKYCICWDKFHSIPQIKRR